MQSFAQLLYKLLYLMIQEGLGASPRSRLWPLHRLTGKRFNPNSLVGDSHQGSLGRGPKPLVPEPRTILPVTSNNPVPQAGRVCIPASLLWTGTLEQAILGFLTQPISICNTAESHCLSHKVIMGYSYQVELWWGQLGGIKKTGMEWKGIGWNGRSYKLQRLLERR